MGKSADAFRTISEVAELLDTPTHVLRFWESKFPQLKPVKRAGGRRYYRPGDVALLGGIKHLLHDEGMTIRSVQKKLREEGIREVSAQSTVVLEDETAEPPAKAEPKTPAAPEPVATEPVEAIAETAPTEPQTTEAETAEEPEAQPELAQATPEAAKTPPSSVTPFPRPSAPAQPSLFDEPDAEPEVEEAPIALDVEPEPEPPAPVVAMTIEQKKEPAAPKGQPSLARLLHNLRQLDPERLSPADRGDLRMLRLRAKALQIRLAQTAHPDAEIRPD
ncbi:MerR family transcriptional regulator [Thioclava pacifica]|uniref:HTH merR-type domain-containing protein n=1 Tax=Thioclava pacifica DSM 10166 TaxID=1353537 RepID=A0A074J6U0_9RHOB|nr:MerR family transcriptional regulator [Thioclava pacifica]KEO51323.1 hypothetical protein TP2_13090 [Thioclava pacifica DSM 10166]